MDALRTRLLRLVPPGWAEQEASASASDPPSPTATPAPSGPAASAGAHTREHLNTPQAGALPPPPPGGMAAMAAAPPVARLVGAGDLAAAQGAWPQAWRAFFGQHTARPNDPIPLLQCIRLGHLGQRAAPIAALQAALAASRPTASGRLEICLELWQRQRADGPWNEPRLPQLLHCAQLDAAEAALARRVRRAPPPHGDAWLGHAVALNDVDGLARLLTLRGPEHAEPWSASCLDEALAQSDTDDDGAAAALLLAFDPAALGRTASTTRARLRFIARASGSPLLSSLARGGAVTAVLMEHVYRHWRRPHLFKLIAETRPWRGGIPGCLMAQIIDRPEPLEKWAHDLADLGMPPAFICPHTGLTPRQIAAKKKNLLARDILAALEPGEWDAPPPVSRWRPAGTRRADGGPRQAAARATETSAATALIHAFTAAPVGLFASLADAALAAPTAAPAGATRADESLAAMAERAAVLLTSEALLLPALDAAGAGAGEYLALMRTTFGAARVDQVLGERAGEARLRGLRSLAIKLHPDQAQRRRCGVEQVRACGHLSACLNALGDIWRQEERHPAALDAARL